MINLNSSIEIGDLKNKANLIKKIYEKKRNSIKLCLTINKDDVYKAENILFTVFFF